MTDSEIVLVLKKDFAEMAGVTAGAISTATKPSNALFGAVINGKINVRHPAAIAYLAEKELRQQRLRDRAARELDLRISPNSSPANERQRGPMIAGVPDVPADISEPIVPEELANLTLLEIVKKYGDLPAFRYIVSANKEIIDYQTKSLKWEEKRGKLVDKELLADTVFDALDLLFNRLIDDVPITLSRKVLKIARENKENSLYLVQKECSEANGDALEICKQSLLEKLESKINVL